PPGEVANLYVGRARHTVVTYHSDIVRQKFLRLVYAPVMHHVLARADRILATSPNYVASSPVLSRWQAKCTVVPLGIDPTPFEGAAPSAEFLERVRGPGNGLLLFVGHLRYYKGLNYLLHALCDIPRTQLVVVGVGPMEDGWRMLARELGLEDRVQFAGDVPAAELPLYYAACDVFVLPSSERSEAFGLVQLEAIAAAKPVVCTELGTGTSFVNVASETGFVVPARDPHALASAITQLLVDDGLRARMGAAGRARVQQHFRLVEMVDRVVALYEDLIFGNN
ncbi:MAG TPA: glycosyltransferase, partial [Anaerolineae bacterium]